MTTLHPMPEDVVLVAIDIAKARNEVLIELPGHKHRRRLTVLNTRVEHDRLVALLCGLGQPVACAFEATGNYHRPIAWRLLHQEVDEALARHQVEIHAILDAYHLPQPKE
jgi:hypothetical protein